jgi:hypothetical protein
MIIDRIPLADRAAYLRDEEQINLAQSPASSGSSDRVLEGQSYELTAISLYIEGEDLYKFLPREQDKPLITVGVFKEMFPSLFADPHANRVHTIAGFEDFQRGALTGMRAMEVEGIPTLVAVGTDESRWVSAVYRLARPTPLAKASWDLAVSRLTPEAVLEFALSLEVWEEGQDVENEQGQFVVLAPQGSKPQDARRNETLMFENGTPVEKAIAYRIYFRAIVTHDTQLEERQSGHLREESVGSPLLRALHLLEPVSSSLSFTSLHELTASAQDYDFLDAPRAGRLRVSLGLPASLQVGEYVTLDVRKGVFKRLEARLEGEIRLRPPAVEKDIA